jgi:hypothetical protein
MPKVRRLYETNLLLLQAYTETKMQSSKKAMDMVDVFRTAAVLLLPV